MAQTILLSSPSLPSFNPPSPDPTPLRMLAFSVAEAALEADPNSPMTPDMSRVPAHDQDEWKGSRLARWCADPMAGSGKETIASRRGRPLWDVVERAKERREREKSSPSTIDSPLPTSPDSYSFILPTNSYLAASITSASPSPTKPSPRKQFPFPLYTRSVEPSPTKSTFSALDQTRPPPEFQPKQRRLSAADFASALPSPTQRLQAQALTRLNYPSPSRHTAKTKLPSLAEIQRKLVHPAGFGAGHRRTGSGGQTPLRRSDSTSSDEALIQTPEEELKSLALVDDVVIRRAATPPAIGGGGAESRLAPFLRQRTSGRLVAGEKGRGRPATMPPISLDEDPISVFAPTLTLTVTPPSATSAEAAGRVPPPSARRPVFTTPPRHANTSARATPASPTDSDSAVTARSSSPTLSIPIITCTPAQQADSDSDSDSDVVVFDGELEKEERSRRGQEMKDRLLLARRRSLH